MKKYLYSFLLVAFCVAISLFTGTTGFTALNNANNPHVLLVPLGSPSSDGVILAGVPTGKSLVVTSVQLVNQAAIAASDTNYVQLKLKANQVEVAELDSRAAHENGIASLTVEPLNVSGAVAAYVVPAGASLSVVYDETDAGTNVALSSAALSINYYVK